MPDLWQTAAEEKLQYHAAIDDCLAQCAATFGGGIQGFGHLRLIELLRWTHRAVLIKRSEEEAQRRKA